MYKEIVELALHEGCIRRASESIFWQRMTAETKDYVSKCDICLMH